MKILLYVWKKKIPILATALIFALLFTGYSVFNTYYCESQLLSFIYPNSEKGQYPDGTRFNIYEIFSDEVLQATVTQYNEQSGHTPINVSDLVSALTLTEYLSPGILEKVQQARNLGQDYTYFVNEYVISCQPIHKLNFKSPQTLFGIIPVVDSEKLLDILYANYSLFFMQEHTEMNIIPRIDQTLRYESYDYIEIANLFEDRIAMYENYLHVKQSENGSFRSESTKMTFNDLIARFQSFDTVHVKNFKSFVSSSRLAKNPTELINKLKAENEMLTVTYEKTKGEADISKKAMYQYDHTFEENIVITGVNDEVGLYQLRPKTAYDTITKRALNTEVDAENTAKDIAENEKLIAEYEETKMTPQERERLTAIADQMVLELEAQNRELVELANRTVDDFLVQKSSNYVRETTTGKSYISTYTLIRAAAFFILGALLALVVLALMDQKNKMHPAGRKNKAYKKDKDSSDPSSKQEAKPEKEKRRKRRGKRTVLPFPTKLIKLTKC